MKTVADRFNDKWVPEPFSGCWIWIGAARRGYAAMHPNLSAARVSWVIHRGQVPRKLQILHRCDTPLCVNPDHLFLGTPFDNKRDCLSKGRHSFGEHRPLAKLTKTDVEKILRCNESSKQLATRFRVDPSTIHRIRKGITWKHINRGKA
jgi:hypothetical protein